MAAYTNLLLTNRTSRPDPAALLVALRGIDASAGFGIIGAPDTTLTVKTTLVPTPNQVLAFQTALDTCAALTVRSIAQSTVDNWPIEFRALVLALIDQLNVIRAALPVPLGAITPAQALAAIRAKAGIL